jgi:hypothetical protein
MQKMQSFAQVMPKSLLLILLSMLFMIGASGRRLLKSKQLPKTPEYVYDEDMGLFSQKKYTPFSRKRE